MPRDEGEKVLCTGGAATLRSSAREVWGIYAPESRKPPTGYEIEDQVLFHLTKFGKIILSLLTFPDPLKGRDEAVPQGLSSASLTPVATHERWFFMSWFCDENEMVLR